MLPDRYWKFVAKDRPNGCWEWTGQISAQGYGRFKLNARPLQAHRMMLQDALGRELDAKELACHHCDNRACVNPAHLFVGSAKENMEDCARKGRTYRPRGARAGERNPAAKLSEAQALEICRIGKAGSAEAVARRFGVSPGTVWEIRRGAKWPHLQRSS